MVPLMTGLLKLPQHRAHGTSLAIIMFVASAGLIAYWYAGNIDWGLVAVLALGSVPGVYLGARTMQRASVRQLRLLFGAFLLAISIRMFIG